MTIETFEYCGRCMVAAPCGFTIHGNDAIGVTGVVIER